MLRKSFVFGIAGAAALAMSGVASAQVINRTSSSKKGSVLIFSKIEIRWDDTGALVQDTFLDITNDYPADVHVQGYFINGDIELPELRDDQGVVTRPYEPGWNTADCRFTLTANQPHYWSAARGSGKCQSFRVLDGNGRPLPPEQQLDANDGGTILRGYAIFWATKFIADAGATGKWKEIYWNHLKGDAVIVNYARKMAWEYNAWSFQALSGSHGFPTGTAGIINLDGVEFEAPFGSLILDFYRPGSNALSVDGETTTVQTDLTVHSASADLRQDGCGPVLTKVDAEIYNEIESQIGSGTKRCVCCWDQTFLSIWNNNIPGAINGFNALGTDKGKAGLVGVQSFDCDNYLDRCGPSAANKREHCERPVDAPPASEDTSILALATKFITYSSGKMEAAGMNVHGTGQGRAVILYDVQAGPSEQREGDREFSSRTLGVAKNIPSERGTMTRQPEAPPAE
jgi:hypothetical protein